MSVGWGCIDGEEVELWGECYNIDTTTHLYLSGHWSDPDNQLTGEIPSEIGGLVNLEQIHLNGNHLSGEIPSEIWELINLENLHLSGNLLTGEIPSEIGNLINLTYLTLYDNQLTGSIPVEIGNLINLDLLHLSYNQLSGEIPESICDLTLDFNQSYPFQIQENNLCPPYPECIVYLGEQDTSECGELSNSDYTIEYSLNKPYPNPFNPTTTISFSVPSYDFVSIKVYDINGGLVSTLVEDYFNQGTHSLTWDGTGLSSGQYLVKMESGSFSKTQIISLIK